jgi:mandelate racemase
MRYAIAAGASDYVMPEVMKIGGVTGWRAAAALAETHSIRMSNHLWPEVSAQLLSTTPMMHWLEYSDWWNPILTAPLELERGFALPADRPGSGIEWNEKALSECLA